MTGCIQSPVGRPEWSFFQNYLTGLSRELFLGKGAFCDFWLVSQHDSGLTNNFLFYTLGCPIKVCLQIFFCRGLCCVETSRSKLIGWFRHGSEFYWGYFRKDFSTVLFLEAVIVKSPFVFYTCGDFIIGGFACSFT